MSKMFKITSGKMILSDPFHIVGDWRQGTIPAKNGDWEVTVQTETNGRIKSISAWNIEAATDNTNLPIEVYTAGELPFVFDVYSGQFGYFDYNSYRNDNNIGDLPRADGYEKKKDGDTFFSVCYYATLDTPDRYSVFPFGIVSRSGYGSGTYQTKGIADKDGNYIALYTMFIKDRFNRYDDWDEEDDEEDDEEPEEEI